MMLLLGTASPFAVLGRLCNGGALPHSHEVSAMKGGDCSLIMDRNLSMINNNERLGRSVFDTIF